MRSLLVDFGNTIIPSWFSNLRMIWPAFLSCCSAISKITGLFNKSAFPLPKGPHAWIFTSETFKSSHCVKVRNPFIP